MLFNSFPPGFGFILFMIIIIINVICADEFGSTAELKGYSKGKYSAMVFFLGLAGMLMVIALPDNSHTETNSTVNNYDASKQQTDDELPEL